MNDKDLNAIARKLVEKYANHKLQEGYTLTGLYPYLDAVGNILYIGLRMDYPLKPKWIRPFYKNKADEWVIGEPEYIAKKPLYGLPYLLSHPDAEIWIVEGERKVDVLTKLGIIAVTSGGAHTADTFDWKVLSGRKIVIWRDFDADGLHYATVVADILIQFNCSIRYVDVDALQLPEKGDVVDWLAAYPKATIEDTLALPMLDTISPVGCKQDKPTPSVGLICASDITPEPISWLWAGWLAAGKFHLLAGEPGTGKTTVAMEIAATISSGSLWPDGSRVVPGHIVIWSGEDDYKDTLVPRLKKAGANTDRIHFINDTMTDKREKRCFDPAQDLTLLQQTLKNINDVRLLIIDPIVSVVTGDSHKNAEVRRDLQPLVDLAMERGCAVLGITHFAKGTIGRSPVERVIGSLAFAALARIVLIAVKHKKQQEDNRTVRVLMRAKSNIGEDHGGFEFEFKQGELPDYPEIFSSYIVWGNPVVGSAADVLAEAVAANDSKNSALSSAKDFLLEFLSHGAVLVEQIRSAANAHGHSENTINKAKRALNIKSHKEPGNFVSKWYWKLPVDTPKLIQNSEDVQQNNRITFDEFDHLRTSKQLAVET